MKKLFKSIVVLVLFLMIFPINTVAEEKHQGELISYRVDDGSVNYANYAFQSHLTSMFQNSNKTTLHNYNLGEAFTVLNVVTNEKIVFFPVSYIDKIEFLLMVTNDGEYSASLSKYFADYLPTLFSGEKFFLVTDGINVAKCTKEGCKTFYNLIQDSFDDINFNLSDIDLEDVITINYKDLVGTIINTKGPETVVKVLESKTINVKGVSQSGSTCWAATCAALINYYKNKSLTYYDVASYVFPNNPNQGGTWNDIKKAYNHWQLYPTQTGVISFTTIKSKINNNKPMHLGLTGHSVGLIGFSLNEFGDGTKERVLVLLEPNGGVRKTVALKSNGNFDYYLTGSNSWHYTRSF